ncbi:MAG: hypothetical protein AB1633_11650 [Elusimicrobiota bacterium]
MFVLIFLFLLSNTCFGGLTTLTADIVVTNLKIGQTYNLTQLANMPYRIQNTGNFETKIVVDIFPPSLKKVKTGYEPIPDVNWVKLSKREFLLLPMEEEKSDIIISIPDDESLLGKKYEVLFHATTRPKKPTEPTSFAISVGVFSSIRFDIAPRPATPEEIQKLERAYTKSLELSLVPNELIVRNVPVGEKIDIKKFASGTLKIVNSGNDSVKMIVRALTAKEAGITPPAGYEPEPDVSFIRVRKRNVKLKSNTIEEINFTIEFPDEQIYKGRKYMFVIESATEGEIIKTQYRSKVYVETRN